MDIMLHIILYVCLITATTQALPDYQSRVPNGDHVIHPCFGNDMWPGVGHKSHTGGGVLNPFGKDFMDNGYKWDDCLCIHDSDGDGKTNGEELGDPNCQFTEGGIPEFTQGISHPGVCEPVDSELCQSINDWTVCEPVDFSCDEITDPDVEEYNFVFPETVIPAEETVYYCMAVEFNSSYTAHSFAMEPVIVNSHLVHHIDLFECTQNADEILRDYKTPGLCNDMPSCGGNQIGAWSLGMSGICLPSDVGLRIGTNGAVVASLRIHYNNPMLRANETDRSGLKIYATPNLRKYEASVMNLQQLYLEIPPGQTEHREEAWMTELCTNTLTQDIYITLAAFHMHYLGIGGIAEIWRNGQMYQEMFRDDNFRFDAPTFKQFDVPIVMKPNDTIRLECIYQSLDRTDITWRGQASTDEMCGFNFVYYPTQVLTSAVNRGTLQTCKFYGGSGIADTDNWDALCNYDEFKTVYNDYMKGSLITACDETGKVCQRGCQDNLEWAFGNHSCLQENSRTAIFKAHNELRLMQSSCKDYPAPATTTESVTQGQDQSGSCIHDQSNSSDQMRYNFLAILWTIYLLHSILN